METVYYTNDNERAALISARPNKYLIEDNIRVDCKFLVFSDDPPSTPIIQEPVDAEKAAMAEAIIDFEARISALEAK